MENSALFGLAIAVCGSHTVGLPNLGRLGSLSVFSSHHWWFVRLHRAYYRPNCRSHFVISPLVLSLDDWIPLFVDLNPLHSSDRGSIGSEGDRLEKVLFWRSSEQFLLKIFFWTRLLEILFWSQKSWLTLTGRWTSSASNPSQDIALSCPIN